MRDALRSQDCLYTVLERGPAGDSARVVGSLVEYLHAQEDRELVLSRLAAASCRIVSLTITEGGYYRNEATGEFNEAHPDIVHDLAHPHAPRCSFGYLVEALDRRRRAGCAPFTVLSCDNVQHNGDTARRMLLAFARTTRSCSGPLDRRTHRIPQQHGRSHRARHDAGASQRSRRRQFGIADAWPVGTEPFRQWVIEDRFPGGRPAWELVGAVMTSDVSPYEKVKMRLLNGSHQAMCYIGMLLGHEFAHDAIADPVDTRPRADDDGRRGHAAAVVATRHRPRRLQAHADRALRQPDHRRHAGAHRHGRFRAHAEVRAAVDRRTTRARAGRSTACASRWRPGSISLPDATIAGGR